MPEGTRATARRVVAAVVAGWSGGSRTTRGGVGALNRSRTRRPRLRGLDWNRTSREPVRYQPDYRTVIPSGWSATTPPAPGGSPRRGAGHRRVGSMAPVVYASVFGAVLASIRALHLAGGVRHRGGRPDGPSADPVDVCCSASSAAARTSTGPARTAGADHAPRDTLFVLISDLIEGGVRGGVCLARLSAMTAASVTVVVLLALSDEGAPRCSTRTTPPRWPRSASGLRLHGRVPDLLAAALVGRDWPPGRITCCFPPASQGGGGVTMTAGATCADQRR
jgi:hypothetical protein